MDKEDLDDLIEDLRDFAQARDADGGKLEFEIRRARVKTAVRGMAVMLQLRDSPVCPEVGRDVTDGSMLLFFDYGDPAYHPPAGINLILRVMSGGPVFFWTNGIDPEVKGEWAPWEPPPTELLEVLYDERAGSPS